MRMTSSGNPVWNKAFDQAARQPNPFQGAGMASAPAAASASTAMTVGGSINASFILLGLCGAGFVTGWTFLPDNLKYIALMAGGLPGLLIAIILCFKPLAAPILAPIYALAQGVFLGSLSQVVDSALANNEWVQSKLGGSVAAAAGVMTLTIFAGMLVAYKTRLIKATATFQKVMGVAMIGVLLFFVASLVASLFGSELVKLSSPLGIGISVVIGLIAAFTLILDFHFIEEGSAAGLPRQMEWYGAFGLLATLIWLYVSILRLLIAIAGSRE